MRENAFTQTLLKIIYSKALTSGNTAPPTYFATVVAAIGDAEISLKESVVWVVIDKWTVVIASPAIPEPTIEVIHRSLSWSVYHLDSLEYATGQSRRELSWSIHGVKYVH